VFLFIWLFLLFLLFSSIKIIFNGFRVSSLHHFSALGLSFSFLVS